MQKVKQGNPLSDWSEYKNEKKCRKNLSEQYYKKNPKMEEYDILIERVHQGLNKKEQREKNTHLDIYL